MLILKPSQIYGLFVTHTFRGSQNGNKNVDEICASNYITRSILSFDSHLD